MYLEESVSGRKVWSAVSVLERGQLRKIQKVTIGFSSYEVGDVDEGRVEGAQVRQTPDERMGTSTDCCWKMLYSEWE